MLIIDMGRKIVMGVASIVASIIILILSLPYLIPNFEKNTVSFSGSQFKVEIADTPAKRTLGLMNRESLAEKSGMLFIFNEESHKSFWMKSTLIPLDMIFVNSSRQIVHIQRNAEPCRSLVCESYSSIKPVKYVIEINGGLSDKFGIKEGDKVDILI